jgi:hypothetical protein
MLEQVLQTIGWALLALAVISFVYPHAARAIVNQLTLAVGAPVLTLRKGLGNGMGWLTAQMNAQMGESRQPKAIAAGIVLLLLAGLILPGALAVLVATLLGAIGASVPFLSEDTLGQLQSISFFAGLTLHAAFGLELLGVSHLGLADKLSPTARRVLGLFVIACLAMGVYTMFHLGEMRTALLQNGSSAADSERAVQILLPLVVELGAVLAFWGATHSLPLILSLGLGTVWSVLRLIDLALEIPDRILASIREILLNLVDFLGRLGALTPFQIRPDEPRSDTRDEDADAEPHGDAQDANAPHDAPTPTNEFAEPYSPEHFHTNGAVETEPIDPANFDPFGVGESRADISKQGGQHQ